MVYLSLLKMDVTVAFIYDLYYIRIMWPVRLVTFPPKDAIVTYRYIPVYSILILYYKE